MHEVIVGDAGACLRAAETLAEIHRKHQRSAGVFYLPLGRALDWVTARPVRQSLGEASQPI